MNATCKICGEPMPEGEEMFFYHGYSGPCPQPPLPKKVSRTDTERLDFMEKNLCHAGEVMQDGKCVKLTRVWAIVGELETLRETVDAMINASEVTR